MKHTWLVGIIVLLYSISTSVDAFHPFQRCQANTAAKFWRSFDCVSGASKESSDTDNQDNDNLTSVESATSKDDLSIKNVVSDKKVGFSSKTQRTTRANLLIKIDDLLKENQKNIINKALDKKTKIANIKNKAKDKVKALASDKKKKNKKSSDDEEAKAKVKMQNSITAKEAKIQSEANANVSATTTKVKEKNNVKEKKNGGSDTQTTQNNNNNGNSNNTTSNQGNDNQAHDNQTQDNQTKHPTAGGCGANATVAVCAEVNNQTENETSNKKVKTTSKTTGAVEVKNKTIKINKPVGVDESKRVITVEVIGGNVIEKENGVVKTPEVNSGAQGNASVTNVTTVNTPAGSAPIQNVPNSSATTNTTQNVNSIVHTPSSPPVTPTGVVNSVVGAVPH